MELEYTEVDGVPAVWTRGAGDSLRLGLMFRVGRSDETFARGGITHLVEHLALHRVGLVDHDFNGSTAPTATTFVARGSATEVCEFVETVCHGLRRLPEERLGAERSILRTEADGRAYGLTERMAMWRYGPASYGLSGYPEFGLESLSIDDLRAWVDRWFTRGNVAIWCVGGPPPEGLRVDLPAGPRMPPALATSALPRTPAYFAADAHGIAFTAVVQRSTAARAYAAVLSRRLRLLLRTDLGLSYLAAADYDPRDAEHGTVLAIADARHEHREQLVGPFIDTLIELATGTVTEDELRVVRSLAADAMDAPEAPPAWANGPPPICCLVCRG